MKRGAFSDIEHVSISPLIQPWTRPTREELGPVQCTADDFTMFRASEGSTKISPSLFGVDTVLWITVATKTGKWADCFTARWHRDKAQKSWLRHAEQDAKSGR